MAATSQVKFHSSAACLHGRDADCWILFISAVSSKSTIKRLSYLTYWVSLSADVND